jgi:hypothetical protein
MLQSYYPANHILNYKLCKSNRFYFLVFKHTARIPCSYFHSSGKPAVGSVNV